MLFVLGQIRHRRVLPEPIRTVGILTCSAIGDTILASGIARDLKASQPGLTTIAFISPSAQGLIEILDGFDEEVVLPITSPRKAVAELTRHRPDVVIDITPWPRITPIVAALSRARYLIGFRTSGEARHWAFDATAEHSASRHELDNYRALLAPLGIAGTRIPQARERFRRLSAMRGNDGPPLLAFHPWASGFRSTLREWPEERWAALGCKVIAEGYDVAITGSPADAIRAHRLSSLIGYPGRVHVTAGASLVATARLFSRTHGVVSVNTGAMHLAAALDTPLVALHGPTDPRRWGPLSEKARVIGPGKAEGGAYLNLGFEYPRDPPDCMRMIAVEEVLQGLREVLEDNGVCQAGTGTGLRALVDAAD